MQHVSELDNISAPADTPARPQPSYTSITFQKTQRRYAERPVNHFPWSDFHLKMTSQGYVVGSEWAMTTFDNRTDDQFFDSKRLQTIDEGTEVRFFYPFEPLDYSNDLPNFSVAEEIRNLDLRKEETLIEKVFYGTKNILARVGHKIRNFYLLACF